MFVVTSAAAQPVAEFYKGRTITIIVGATESGAFSIYARALAEAMPRYLPGNPKIIVQAMPGAGGTVMANHMYNVAPKDGLTIGTPMVTMPITQIQRPESVRYDSARFQWIGNLDGSPAATLVTWHETPIQDIRRHQDQAAGCRVVGQRLGDLSDADDDQSLLRNQDQDRHRLSRPGRYRHRHDAR